MKPNNQQHILNASSNLISVCLILVTGLKISNQNNVTWLDDVSLLAAFVFIASCFLSYLSMRSHKYVTLYEKIADQLFLLGLLMLFVAVAAFSKGYI